MSREKVFAFGVKAGLIPPVLSVAEFVVRTQAIVMGVYGIVTDGGPIGDGGTRTNLGFELTYEIRPGRERRSSPYITASSDYYHAAKDSHGFFETSHALYTTAGYIWKASVVEFYLGGGLVFLLADELPPPNCTAFCFRFDSPPVLPTAELGLRLAFF